MSERHLCFRYYRMCERGSGRRRLRRCCRFLSRWEPIQAMDPQSQVIFRKWGHFVQLSLLLQESILGLRYLIILMVEVELRIGFLLSINLLIVNWIKYPKTAKDPHHSFPKPKVTSSHSLFSLNSKIQFIRTWGRKKQQIFIRGCLVFVLDKLLKWKHFFIVFCQQEIHVRRQRAFTRGLGS